MTRSTGRRLRELQEKKDTKPGLIRVQEIILEAVDLLQRSSKVKWDEEQCDADVRRFIDNIWNTKPPSRDLPKERKQLRAAIRSLERADRAIEKITSENSIYKKLQENHIRPALEATRFFAKHITFRSGPRKRFPGTPKRLTTAASAAILIQRWTDGELTVSTNSLFLKLSRLLYEAGTGKPEDEGPGLERACRDYAKLVASHKTGSWQTDSFFASLFVFFSPRLTVYLLAHASA
jgi:hypothetical protein